MNKKVPAAELKSAPAAAEVKHSSAFEIEDGIAFPVRRSPGSSESMYPFKDLAVGQSFFIPVSDKIATPWKTFTSVASRCSRDLHPKQFTTARDTKNGIEGVRIWRKPDTTEALKPPKKINRKPRGDAAEKARLAQEAVEGDTSRRQPPEDPQFDLPPPPAA